MNSRQITMICFGGFLFFSLGLFTCSQKKSTRELGYYYIDEDESEKQTVEESSTQVVKQNKEQESTTKAGDAGFYYIEEEEPEITEPVVQNEPLENQIKKEEPATEQPKVEPEPAERAQVEEKPTPNTEEKQTATNAEQGKASYYGDKFHGRPTASGEPYDRNKLTAAHKTLSFGTVCKVTNLANGKSVQVSINDRGPHVKSRVIDLSYTAMQTLDGITAGIINVKVEIVSTPK